MREAGNQRSPLSERPADVGAERGDQVLKQKSDTVAHIRDYRLSRLPVFQQLFCLVESGTGQIQIERATVYPPARPLLPQRPELFGVLGRFQAMRRNRPPAAFALDFERNPTLPRTALPFSCSHPCFEVRTSGDHLLAAAEIVRRIRSVDRPNDIALSQRRVFRVGHDNLLSYFTDLQR